MTQDDEYSCSSFTFSRTTLFRHLFHSPSSQPGFAVLSVHYTFTPRLFRPLITPITLGMVMFSLSTPFFLNWTRSANCAELQIQAGSSLWNYTLSLLIFLIFCTHFLLFLPNSVATAFMMKVCEARSVVRSDASFIRSANVDVRAHRHMLTPSL